MMEERASSLEEQMERQRRKESSSRFTRESSDSRSSKHEMATRNDRLVNDNGVSDYTHTGHCSSPCQLKKSKWKLMLTKDNSLNIIKIWDPSVSLQRV